MSYRITNTRRASELSVEPLEDREAPAVLYALTNSQRLQLFDSANPGVLLNAVTLRGMVDPGEKITDIDIRPATGWMYGRSDHGRIYLIDALTGNVAPVSGQVAFGANVATAFNPLTDQLLFNTFSGGSTLINPFDGSVISVGNSSLLNGDLFQGLTPRLSALAFANGGPLATAAQLFGIDPVTDTLVSSTGLPNPGPFSTIGSLGIDVRGAAGFDIDPATGMAFATFQANGGTSSYLSTINLSTGQATVLGPVGPSAPLILDIAVAPGSPATGTLVPAGIDPTQLGFSLTNLGTTIFGPSGLNSGILSGVNPAFVTNLVNGLTSGTITSIDPTVLSGLNTALNNGLIPGISPSLASAFNAAMAGFNPVTGVNQTLLGLPNINSGLGTGLFANTGLNSLTTGLNSGLFNPTLGSSLFNFSNPLGLNTGLGGTLNSLFGAVPTSPLTSSLIQPLSPGLVGGSIFNPGPAFGFDLPIFSGGT